MDDNMTIEVRGADGRVARAAKWLLCAVSPIRCEYARLRERVAELERLYDYGIAKEEAISRDLDAAHDREEALESDTARLREQRDWWKARAQGLAKGEHEVIAEALAAVDPGADTSTPKETPT